MPAAPHAPTCDAPASIGDTHTLCTDRSAAMLRILDPEALAAGYPAVIVLCERHLELALASITRLELDAEVTPWP